MTRALIIDDELDICYLLSNILNSNDMQVNHVNCLADAEAILKENPHEIIFLDNYLPDGMGTDAISKLKSAHPDTKIIMITAFDNSSDRTSAINNGADYFIPKPFSREVIFKTVNNLLSTSYGVG